MNKVNWIVLSMIGICLVIGCSSYKAIKKSNTQYDIAVKKIEQHIPGWLKEPITEKNPDKISAIGIASPSIIPEVSRSRAQNDLYNNLARSVSTHVTVQLREFIEDHPIFQELDLSRSQLIFQRISNQVSQRQLNNIVVNEYWIDKKGIFGGKGISYCYGGINKAGAEVDGLNAFAKKLKKDKIRMKLSKEAEEKLNRLIENMYKRAAEIEREASEQLERILGPETQ